MVTIQQIKDGIAGLSPTAKAAIAAGTAITVGGIAVGVVAASRKKKSKKRKSKNSRKRTSKNRRRKKQKKPYTAGKRKDRSTKRIRYTKNNQPYVILKSGKARFIKKSSARLSRKRKGGRY